MKPEKKVYETYVLKCKDSNTTPIQLKEFTKVLENGVNILQDMLQKGDKEPYIAIEIDANFIMYEEIQGTNLVINIWDREQFNLLIGRKK